MLSRPVRFGLAYAAVIAAVALLFVRLPSFLPEEDQGSFNAMVILPQGATQAETRKLVLEVENYMMKHEPVRFVYSVSGFSEYGSGPNSAMFFVTLKDWKERHGADMHVDAVVARVNKAFADHKNAMVLALNAPPLPELDLELRLPAAGPRRPGLPGLTKARQQLLAAAAEHPALAEVTHAGQGEAPQLQLRIDRDKAQAMRVSMEKSTPRWR